MTIGLKPDSLTYCLPLTVLVAASVSGAVRYVAADNATPISPYTNWVTAATTIQDAIDVAVAGDEIVVTNGDHQRVAWLGSPSRPGAPASKNSSRPAALQGHSAGISAGSHCGDSRFRAARSPLSLEPRLFPLPRSMAAH